MLDYIVKTQCVLIARKWVNLFQPSSACHMEISHLFCQYSHFIPPENTRKPLVFRCFQGGIK